MSPKSVLITGCSAGGIGHALIISFQKRGFTVFATARSVKKMQDLASLANVHLISLDVTLVPSIDAAVTEVFAKTNGKLDVLVNNAGAQFVMPALDIDIDAAKDFFDLNYWSSLRMVQKFASMLIAAKGCIVNVSSSAAIATAPFQSQYNASKAAMTMLSETMRLELEPLNVRVVTLVAGGTKSKIAQNGPPPQSLPPTSQYLIIEKHIAQGVEWKQMPTETFAERVVNDIVRGARGKVYHGVGSTIVRYAVPLMPQWIFDRIMLSVGRGLQHMPKQ